MEINKELSVAKTVLVLVLGVTLLIPHVTLAAWWNPFSWFQTPQVQKQTTSTTTVSDLQEILPKPSPTQVSPNPVAASKKAAIVVPKIPDSPTTRKSVSPQQTKSKTSPLPNETGTEPNGNTITPASEKPQKQLPPPVQVQAQTFTLSNGAVVDINGNIIKPAPQSQVQNVQQESLQPQPETNFDNSQCASQITQIQNQIIQLRQKALATEGAYLTGGMTSSVAQGKAQQVIQKEAQEEAPLLLQMQQIGLSCR